jgi:hypothetical protein
MRNKLTMLTAAGIASLTVAVAAATLQNITGTVTDSGANPLDGIQVSFFDAVNAELLAGATTDALGQYDSGNIPPGSYGLRLSDPTGTFGPQFLGAARKEGANDEFCDGTIVPVPESTSTRVDAQMGPLEPRELAGLDEPIFGTVVDAATGTPLQGIHVSIRNAWSAEEIATVTTDAEGGFSFGSKDTQMSTLRVRFSDPTGTFFPEFYGAGSDAFCNALVLAAGSRTADGFLDRVPPEHLTQRLADTVQNYDLPPSVATMLGTPLTHVRKLLADDRAGNNEAACGQLASFVSRVDVQERRRELSAAEADELRRQATNLRAELGCR